MDTSDPGITFGADGVCHHCRRAALLLESQRATNANFSGRSLEELVAAIKKRNRGKPYDCVIGISGGVDSTYLAYRVHQFGLRPLAVHVDNGWNTPLSLENIGRLMAAIGVELQVHTLDWAEFKELQLAFLRASVPDLDIPTDHALTAVLRRLTLRHDLKYMIFGTNVSTESILPTAWAQGHGDWRYIRSIHERFGRGPLTAFPHLTYRDLVDQEYSGRLEVVSLLDHLGYSKKAALRVLEEELGWRNYGGKHYESIYTRFVQGYILPVKFGIDKRRAHLSSLIVSGELTREEALRELAASDYPPELAAEDREAVLGRLGLTASDFEELMSRPPRSFRDYPSYQKSLKGFKGLPLRLYKSLRKRCRRLAGGRP